MLATGCKSIDEFTSGGIKTREITLVYGESGSGKTTFLLQCIRNCTLRGARAIFIDADNTFSSERLKQIANKDLSKIAPRILLFQLSSFNEQAQIINHLEKYLTKGSDIRLIVVDTITNLYRRELGGSSKNFSLNRELNRQVALLLSLARNYDVALLLASQVRGVFEVDAARADVEPVAAAILNYWARLSIQLSLTDQLSMRKATVKIAKTSKELITELRITSEGLVD